MKVFMLGWEFPPVVSGGLGVACYGLAKALNGHGVDVLFVLPKPRGAGAAKGGNGSKAASAPRAHHEVKAVAAATAEEVQHAVEQAVAHAAAAEAAQPVQGGVERVFEETYGEVVEEAAGTVEEKLQRVTFVPLDAWLQPYLTAEGYQRMVVEEVVSHRPVARWEKKVVKEGGRWVERAREGGNVQPPNHPHGVQGGAPMVPAPVPFRDKRSYIQEPAQQRAEGAVEGAYGGDLFEETERYARLALAVAKNDDFDVIHAHDWMTFEAAMAVAAESGAPLVVQIHSTELDRAGHSANARIMEVERQGMLAADLVIAVSYKTKTQLIDRYGIDPQKIEVVYNATEPKEGATAAPASDDGAPREKSVLFLGRLTQQKGPGYFLQAARKVLSVEPEVKFVLAGQGEMAEELRTLATELGIRRKVVFAGFLKKAQAEKALAHADVYVMPSVSEPFGIAPLEALANDVPVIISKQSGVAEVLQHVLKVDFWDTDDLANKIVAVLRHPSLAATLRERGAREVRLLSWDDSAQKIIGFYEQLVEEEVAEDADEPAAGEEEEKTTKAPSD